jgi:hypothetical protein
MLMLAATGLAAMLLPRQVWAAEDGRTSPPPPAGQANPNPGPEDPYWTPERLRRARPRELPAPEARPRGPEPPRTEGGGSAGRGGSPGEGGIPPGTETLIPPPPRPGSGGTPGSR